VLGGEDSLLTVMATVLSCGPTASQSRSSTAMHLEMPVRNAFKKKAPTSEIRTCAANGTAAVLPALAVKWPEPRN
jgi:hypothetical protein